MTRTTVTRDYGSTFPADRFIRSFVSGAVSFETARTSLSALSMESLQALSQALSAEPMLNHGHGLAADLRSMLETVNCGIRQHTKGTNTGWSDAALVLG